MMNLDKISPQVEKCIVNMDVSRVLQIFTSLGQTDIVCSLNEKFRTSRMEFDNTLLTLEYYVQRGLKTQRYLTEQMRTDTDPSDWPYDPKIDNPFTNIEERLMNKFGTRWPTVSGALDMIHNKFKHCVEKKEWKDSTGLTYRAWVTVDVCPDKILWGENTSVFESEQFLSRLRPKFMVFYPGLVNLAFLEESQIEELERNKYQFDDKWRDMKFRRKVTDTIAKVIGRCNSIGNFLFNCDSHFRGEKLDRRCKIMYEEFCVQRKRLENADTRNFSDFFFARDFSYAGDLQNPENPWQPTDSAGCILHFSKMMVDRKFRRDDNPIYKSDSLSKIKEYGIVYAKTRRSNPESSSGSAEKNKESGKLRDTLRKELKENSLKPRNSDRGSWQTRTESHGQQQGDSNKKVESQPPAKKVDSSDKVKAHPPGHSLRRAEPLQSVGKRAEAKKSSKKPDPQVVPSSSRTGGSGATSRRHG
ncbi:uncharacterized protein EAE97_006524 [Botrytis byssoidea]|uniref:Uncharacterized protein n=1 Tax=Botrytis byssoidea TaxID=139641 RepID=A0A9P5M665_9HELO|nr:uncharacterized protein EAE97_006524 [Botrytis byssoidea]KAF7941687.1 hypothetical protein EAE97_006524 [Botrytis byssoidea]